jgi:poly(A) polymerase
LDLHPKDFDVATDATPEQIKALFRNCRLIGRRFRLAHIHFGRDYIEVATFRGTGDGHPDDDREVRDGRVLFDNVYGDIEEDAQRRDFTVNGMYYDIRDFSIRDYSTGFEDLKKRQIRLIGDPEERYREDPVRLIRAIRFAAKLEFEIESASEAPLSTMGGLLEDIPAARMFEEILKLFMSGHAERSFELLMRHQLLDHLFPQSAAALEGSNAADLEVLRMAMRNTDKRIAEDKPVTPAFLFGVLLWPAYSRRYAELTDDGMLPHDAGKLAADQVVRAQISRTSIPKRFSYPMREIWEMQPRLEKKSGRRIKRLLAHPRFRAAYDFLLLRAEQYPELAEQAQWWTEMQSSSGASLDQPAQPKRRPRRGRRRRSKPNKQEAV